MTSLIVFEPAEVGTVVTKALLSLFEEKWVEIVSRTRLTSAFWAAFCSSRIDLTICRGNRCVSGTSVVNDAQQAHTFAILSLNSDFFTADMDSSLNCTWTCLVSCSFSAPYGR